MNREKMFWHFRNIKDIIERKQVSFSINQIRTGMQNLQTYSIANLHRVTTMVLLTHGEGNRDRLWCDPWHCIGVPIGIHLVRAWRCQGHQQIFFLVCNIFGTRVILSRDLCVTVMLVPRTLELPLIMYIPTLVGFCCAWTRPTMCPIGRLIGGLSGGLWSASTP